MSWQALAILSGSGGVEDTVKLRHVAYKELSGHSVRRMAALQAARAGGGQGSTIANAAAAVQPVAPGTDSSAAHATPPAPLPEGLADREVAFWRSKGTPLCKCSLPTCIVQATSKDQGGRFITKCLVRYKVHPCRSCVCFCIVYACRHCRPL